MAPLIPQLISRLGNRVAPAELAHNEPGNGNYCISCLLLPPGAGGYALMDAELGNGPRSMMCNGTCGALSDLLCHPGF